VFAQQRAQRAVGDRQATERQQRQSVDRQRDDAQFGRQHAVQTGQRQREEGQHEQGQRGRQEVGEEALLARQMAAEGDAARHRGEDPRTLVLRGIGVVPDEQQAERRPQSPQRRQRQHQRRRQSQGGAEAGRAMQQQHRPGDQQEHQRDVAGEQHQMRHATPQHGATEARLGIEADRVAHRSHGQRVGGQQGDQHQGMHAERGDRHRDPPRREPDQGLHEGRAVRLGIGHAASIGKRGRGGR